jgi:hypothetical protein
MKAMHYIVKNQHSRRTSDWFILTPKLRLRWWERLLGFTVDENNVRQWRWKPGE